jgi:polar amino acid transport system substrate-binding protein
MTIRWTLALLACLAVLTAACGKETDSAARSSSAPSETTIAKCVNNVGGTPPAEPTGAPVKTIKSGVLTVGSDTEFPPFESIEKGKAVGFDVDLITEIATRIGIPKVDYQTAVFDTIFTALAAGKFDVVVSGVTIRADRKKTVDFSDPYYKSDLSLSVSDSDAGTIKGVDDLSGEILGVQSGTTSETCAKSVLKSKVKDIRSYDTVPDAFTDMAAGRVGAVMIDYPTAKQIIEKRGGSRIVQIVKTNEDYGIAVAKTNPDLRVAINKALGEMKDDGTYARLFKKWFKTEPPA